MQTIAQRNYLNSQNDLDENRPRYCQFSFPDLPALLNFGPMSRAQVIIRSAEGDSNDERLDNNRLPEENSGLAAPQKQNKGLQAAFDWLQIRPAVLILSTAKPVHTAGCARHL